MAEGKNKFKYESILIHFVFLGLILKSGMSSTQFVEKALGALKISFTDAGPYSLYNISQNRPVRALSEMENGYKLRLLSNLLPTTDNQISQVSKF